MLTRRRPIRPAGWAFRLRKAATPMKHEPSLPLFLFQAWAGGFGVAGCLAILLSGPVNAQHVGPGHEPAQHQVPPDHDHAGVTGGSWEGSPEGKAYSEFNHHMAGVFVLLIGLSEFRYALALTPLAWTRFLLPMAMLGAGGFLMVWSDHEAWPIGSLSFVQTFFGSDWEILQHKLYGVYLMAVGTIVLPRRTGRIAQHWWRVLLPVFAILGGLAAVPAQPRRAPGRAQDRDPPHHHGDLGDHSRIVQARLRLGGRTDPCHPCANPSPTHGPLPVGTGVGQPHPADWHPVTGIHGVGERYEARGNR